MDSVNALTSFLMNKKYNSTIFSIYLREDFVATNDLQFEIIKSIVASLLTLLVSFIVLYFGWYFGNKITIEWNLKQKRREIQLDRANQFFQLYGEFFATWRVYNHLHDNEYLDDKERCIEIFKRASAAEAGIEAILIKIASERKLDADEIKTLGCFRQSYQLLRKTIESKERFPFSSPEDHKYLAFKKLSCKVAQMLLEDNKFESPTKEKAFAAFSCITSSNWRKRYKRLVLDPDKSYLDEQIKKHEETCQSYPDLIEP